MVLRILLSDELTAEPKCIGCILLLIRAFLHYLVLAALETALVAGEGAGHLFIIVYVVALGSRRLLNGVDKILVWIAVHAASDDCSFLRGVAVVAVAGLYSHRHLVHLGAHLLMEQMVVLTQRICWREVIKLH